MRGMGDESAVGPAGGPSAALEGKPRGVGNASSHYEGRTAWHSSAESRRPNRCPFGDDPCDRGPEVDFLGAQTDRPTRHTALRVRCAIRQLELIREIQHRSDASLWT
jgi:hypothetical protein